MVWRSIPGGGVQTGPGSHPASYAMGTGSFPAVKRPGVALTTSALRLKKE